MQQLELYVYSTKNDLKEGLLKVGHCKIGHHKERIRQQFGTSNSGQPETLWVHPLPEGLRDHHIHKQLETNGIKRSKGAGKEWFYATLDDVKVAFNQVVSGVSRAENYTPRKEQVEAIKKAVKWFNKEYSDEVYNSASHQNRFLLNAKMRFGKCFTSLHIAKEIKAKNTIVVTYKPEVINEWMEVINGHVDFDGWIGVRARKKHKNSIEPSLSANGEFPMFDGAKILCVSLQDLTIDSKGNTKIRLENVLATKWDLIIFDEVHFGSRTKRALHILENLDVSKSNRLDLSGTPFKLIQQDDFCTQQIFTYSYIDEQENKKREILDDPNGRKINVYREMPNLNISTIEITDQDINEQRETFLTDDMDFSLNELFKANKKGFIYKDAVDHFLEGLTKNGHDARAISVFGKLGQQLGTPPVRHTVWWLNRVNSISALVKTLKAHPYFSKFEVINASGCENDNDETIIARDKSVIEEKIKEVNESSTKLGTITLTCKRFLTGVTIREWDSILILTDVKSAEAYYQAIFRVQSAWVEKLTRKINKNNAWVFDFAISRCLRLTHEYAKALADQLDQQDSHNQELDLENNNLTQTVEGLCSTLDIKRFFEGSLVSNPTTAKDIFEALKLDGSQVSLAKRITSDALLDFGALRLLDQYPHIYEILKKVKGYRTQEVGSIEDFVRIGLDAVEKEKKNPPIDQDDIEQSNEEFVDEEKNKKKKSRKKWYGTQVKRLAICMADFIYMTYEREYSIEDVISTKSPEFFEIMTGISKNDFSELCDKGFINRFVLNKIVREFRDLETSSLCPEEYILENILRLAS